MKENYLQSNIEYSVSEANGRKRVTFDINSGPRFHDVKVELDGVKGLSASKLRDVIDSQKLDHDVYVASTKVTDTLTRLYQEFGYLDAKKAPKYELNAQTGTGRVVFPIDEGPQYVIRNVAFEGNAVVNDARLAEPFRFLWRSVQAGLEEHAHTTLAAGLLGTGLQRC